MAENTKVYGIKNCNTVKKALDWLNIKQIPYEFHDFKKLGISESKLNEWAGLKGWEALINRKGTTWKGLPEELKNSVVSKESGFQLMTDKTSVIKRPVIERNGRILQGFDESELEDFFKD